MHNSDALSAPDYSSVTLTDNAGNVIVWNFANVGKLDKWNELSVKIGFNENSNANWVASVGPKAAFNWYVTKIKIMFYRDADPGTLLYLLLDGLKFPAATVAANDQTPRSVVHTLRPCKIVRTDITTQVELQQFADQLSTKLASAIPSLNLMAVGSCGLIGGVWKWLPGYYASANIKDANGNYLVALNSKWRFMELTHVFDPKAPLQGHVYTVALKMVLYDLVVDNQRWSYSNDPGNSPIRRVRDRLRYIENTQSGTI